MRPVTVTADDSHWHGTQAGPVAAGVTVTVTVTSDRR